MEKAKILEKLIKEKGYSIRSFAQKCEIPESTLYTILKKGVGRASMDNILTICRNLDIKVEELDEMTSGKMSNEFEPSYDDLKQLIARNGKDMTQEEKMELIKMLSTL